MAENKKVIELILQLTKRGEDIKKLANEYKQGFSSIKAEAKSLSNAYNILGMQSMKKLTREAQRNTAAFNRLKNAYRQGKISLLEYKRAQEKLRENMTKLKSEALGWKNALGKLKSGLIALAGVGYTLTKSFGAFSDFEKKMAEVSTLVNASKGELKSLRDEILNLSTQVPQSASQLASAEYDIISAGVKLKDSMTVLKLSAKAAVAGVTDTKTAVQAGLGVLNAYGLNIDHLQEVYDTLFTTIKDGVTTFPELAQYIGQALPIARQAGVSFKEVGASIATMTKAGIKTPEAVTALKGAIRALVMPTAQAKKVMDQLGITWKGLIPTLKELQKYTKDPEILSRIIPDIQARTGLLSLIQNFRTLTATLNDMNYTAGATKEAYGKIADTPAMQIQMFKNEVNKLAIELGGLISKALLPMVRAIRELIEGFNELNPVSRTYIEILLSAGAGFAIWKMGLGSLVSAMMNFITTVHTTLPLMEAFTTEFTALKAAVAGGIVISIAVTGYNLVKLIGEMRELNVLTAQAKKRSNEYMQAAQKYKAAAQVQILSKEQLLQMSEKERQEYKENLKNAMLYYSNLTNAEIMASTEAKKFLGIPLPFASERAKEAQKNIKKFEEKTNKYTQALHVLMSVEKQTFSDMSKSLQATHPHYLLSITDAKLLGATLQNAYKSAERAMQEWANKAKFYEDQLRREKMSTADLIRSLDRKTMSAEEAWYDKKKEADEKLAAAEKALKQKNFELAKKLTEQAKQLYADLAHQVVQTNKDGTQEVVVDLDTAVDTAKDGIKKASGVMQEIIKANIKHSKDMVEVYKEKVNQINSLMKKLTQPGTKEIKLEVPEYEKVWQQLQALTASATKYIHVKYVSDNAPAKSGEVEGHRYGGVVGYAFGGKLPGYGGGDIVPALLEPGEFVVRKESVKKYGLRLLSALNEMKLPVNIIPKFQTGGVVENFNYWGVSVPVDLTSDPYAQFYKVWAYLKQAGVTYYLGAINPYIWKHNYFDPWWVKEITRHAAEIAKSKVSVGKTTSGDRVQIDLSLGGKTYPVEGDRNTIRELLSEIERLKAIGYA